MGNSLRCCLACLVPCGALDMIRIVHLNGQIDEYSHSISVGEILAANPNHIVIVSRPYCSSPSPSIISHSQGQGDQLGVGGTRGRIMILSPHSELKRGKLYFLIPTAPNYSTSTCTVPEKIRSRAKKKHKKIRRHSRGSCSVVVVDNNNNYLAELLSEGKQSHHHRHRHRRRSVRRAVWRPNLQCIPEESVLLSAIN